MPAFHTHRTFITSNECTKCMSKAFNPMNSSTDEPGVEGPLKRIEYLFDHYGKEKGGFIVMGEALRDEMCVREMDPLAKNETQLCSVPGQGIEFFSVWDFRHDVNVSYFDEMPYDGLLGIGPSTDET